LFFDNIFGMNIFLKTKQISADITSPPARRKLKSTSITRSGRGFFNLRTPLSGYLIGCLFLLFLTSCGSLREPEFLGVDRVQLGKLGLGSTRLSLDVHYRNPNGTGVKLKSARGEIWIDGKSMGQFEAEKDIRIPPRGEFVIPVTVETNGIQLLKNTLSLLLNGKTVVRLEGTARLSKGLISLQYPIRYEGKQDLSKLLKE